MRITSAAAAATAMASNPGMSKPVRGSAGAGRRNLRSDLRMRRFATLSLRRICAGRRCRISTRIETSRAAHSRSSTATRMRMAKATGDIRDFDGRGYAELSKSYRSQLDWP